MFLLTNNDLVIADVFDTSTDTVNLNMPAVVLSNRIPQGDLGFIILPWQPFELLDSTIMVLSRTKNVFCDLLPSPGLIEYYRSWKHNEEDKRNKFSKRLAEQLQQITKLTNMRHHEMVAGDSYEDFTAAVNEKFEHDTEWGDPSANN
jgi:hypothetical protein